MPLTSVTATRPTRVRRGCRLVTTSLTARVLLANQLRALDGIAWTVVSGDAYDDPPDGVEVAVVPIRREFASSDLTSFVQLWQLLRRERFDFVQTHTPKASFLGLPAARLAGTPAIYTIHGSLYFEGNDRKANVLGWCFERWCCAWADRVLLQSTEDERVLPAARICRAGKLTYLGQRHRHGPVHRHRHPGTVVGPPARGDGQPPGPREGMCRLPGAGRVTGRKGRLRPRRTLRARPERCPDRCGGG